MLLSDAQFLAGLELRRCREAVEAAQILDSGAVARCDAAEAVALAHCVGL